MKLVGKMLSSAAKASARGMGKGLAETLTILAFWIIVGAMIVGAVIAAFAYVGLAIAAIFAIWFVIKLLLTVVPALRPDNPNSSERLNRPGPARDAVMNVSREDQP